MLQRSLVCGLLLFLAVTCDQGWPTWIDLPVAPSFLSLVLVLMCQFLRGAELVAWAGAVGLYQDFLDGHTPGVGVMTAATLGLIVAQLRGNSPEMASVTDRLLSGLGLLLGLTLIRGLHIFSTGTHLETRMVVSSLLIRAAATFLLFVVVTGIWSGIHRCCRRTYRLDNSYLKTPLG